MDWNPPPGMNASTAGKWRVFYAAIRRSYGITPQEYRALYLAQSGRCYICRKAKGVHPDDPKGYGSRRLGVDHNHAIGSNRQAVRGLLCTGGDRTCNRIVGWLSAPALARASEYLIIPPAQQVLVALAAGATDSEITGMVCSNGGD